MKTLNQVWSLSLLLFPLPVNNNKLIIKIFHGRVGVGVRCSWIRFLRGFWGRVMEWVGRQSIMDWWSRRHMPSDVISNRQLVCNIPNWISANVSDWFAPCLSGSAVLAANCSCISIIKLLRTTAIHRMIDSMRSCCSKGCGELKDVRVAEKSLS